MQKWKLVAAYDGGAYVKTILVSTKSGVVRKGRHMVQSGKFTETRRNDGTISFAPWGTGWVRVMWLAMPVDMPVD